jgi:TadE-like protein
MLKKFRRSEDGSLTLEAAMVMPVFLLFVVFLATIIRISVADMALRNAVNDTAEVVAAHVYPAALLENGVNDALDSKIKAYTRSVVSLEDIKTLANSVLKELDISIMDYVNGLAGNVLTSPVQSKFEQSNKDALFNKEKLKVEVELPSSLSGGEAYVEIKASYEVSITAPFVNKKITLHKKAYERLWSGA